MCVCSQLPRHKTVVVQLNNSDDSDSDEQEASSSRPSVFGGLEFMIKEARRTVEVSGHLSSFFFLTNGFSPFLLSLIDHTYQKQHMER